MDDKAKLIGIVLLTAVAAFFAWPSADKPGFREFPDGKQEFLNGYSFKLGLDLQGGSELRLALKRRENGREVLPAGKVAEATRKAVETLERRINVHGLKEPRITTYGEDQILVQLPGIDAAEVQRVKTIITTSGKLQFKLVADEEVQRVWESSHTVPQGYRVYTRRVSEEHEKEGEHGETLLIRDREEMTGEEVATAADKFSLDTRSGFEVELRLTEHGRRTFAKLTSENVHRRLAIILDEKLISAPEIREPINGGTAQITGNFGAKEAKDLGTVLRSGSLPAGIELIAENSVGPSLGEDSVRRGTAAGVIALVAVLVFMVYFYRTAGVVANVALFMNVVFLVGLLAVFQATLTLPGIAGIILTMGMAVDSNIIIYERIREERERGKPLLTAFEAGFDRAFWTVFDSNITTLIAGVVLYYEGTGPIKGFAVTLCLGILTTLFTALTCTQTMLRALITNGIGGWKVTELRMLSTFKSPKFPFMSLGRTCILGSGAVIGVTMLVFFLRGDRNYGIDFNGGTILNVRFAQAVEIDEIRKTIAGIPAEGAAGKPKYPDVEVQRVLAVAGGSDGAAQPIEFAVRTGALELDREHQKVAPQEQLKKDLLGAFAGKVPSEPIVFPVPGLLEKPGHPYHGGQRIVVNLSTALTRKDIETKLAAICKKAEVGDANLRVPPPESETSASSFEFVVRPEDNGRVSQVEAAILDKESGLALSENPFPSVQNIGPSVARDLKWKAIVALFWSWLAMIVYLAIRFDFKFALGAVVALIHDVLVCIGVQSVVQMLLPGSFGISLDMGLPTVASWLTIIGYSVNDTIVIFDRIRENMREMKREPLEVILNASINQTLSRTILTSMTVFLTVLALFAFTARSGGGVAGFSFPMIVGVITGTYSSIYIASYLVLRLSPRSRAA
ncbi:MAG: protein translocase subunit SecD [Planctomycetes bacterium]|nr:protein translocase subunit SecD [Planctomycetota bacterium]